MKLTTEQADWLEDILEQLRDCGADEKDVRNTKEELLSKLKAKETD